MPVLNMAILRPLRSGLVFSRVGAYKVKAYDDAQRARFDTTRGEALITPRGRNGVDLPGLNSQVPHVMYI